MILRFCSKTPPSGFAAHLPFQGRLISFFFAAKIGGHGTTCPYKYTKSCAQLEQPFRGNDYRIALFLHDGFC